MSLVPSLLQAILRLDGEALVMHVGEKPYVVTPSGQSELASRALTLEAVIGMVGLLLAIESQRVLDEFGAAQHELPPMPEFPHEHFTVVAARGGDDVWMEIRRYRIPDEDAVPAEIWDTPAPAAVAQAAPHLVPPPARPGIPALSTSAVPPDEHLLARPDASQLWPDGPASRESDLTAGSSPLEQPSTPARVVEMPSRPEPLRESTYGAAPAIVAPPQPVAPVAPEPAAVGPAAAARVDLSSAPARDDAVAPPAPMVARGIEPPRPAVVLPLSRNPVRGDVPPPLAGPAMSGLDRLLRIAAARGASTLYLSSQARPSVRVDGEIQVLEGEAPLSASDVESLLIDLMPERNREALRSGVGTEWICDVTEVGRVRCMSFRDHRGAGGIFRMMPVRAISADQLGLSREIQALAAEPEGLVLVAGPRSSGKSTLISAFVDLINRTRRDHVITIESEIKIVHEHRSSLVSQREVRGSNEEMLAVARAALRENPDVLVFEELRTPEIVGVALEAAASGHLVLGALPAHTATGAVDRIIDSYPPEHRRQVQLALAENLRGIVAQVLVRKPGGGRVAAREVLLNTPAVASVMAEGKTSQLPAAMEGGRKYGMVPLNDALVGFVQSGAIDAREAYRRAADRTGFLALLKRQGVDTSFVERLA